MKFSRILTLAMLAAALGVLGNLVGALSPGLVMAEDLDIEFVTIDVTKSADAQVFAEGMEGMMLPWTNRGEGHELFSLWGRTVWDIIDDKNSDKEGKKANKKVNIAQVDIEEAGWKKEDGEIKDQADILYLGAHGYAKTGTIEYEEVIGPGSLVADPTKFNFKAWAEDLDWAIFVLCSVLQVDLEGKGDPEKYSPGLKWAKALKENPGDVHGLLGYRRNWDEEEKKHRSAPPCPTDVSIAYAFVKKLERGLTFVNAWIDANEEEGIDTWAIIVWDCYSEETLSELIEVQYKESEKKCNKILYFDKYNLGRLDITDKVFEVSCFPTGLSVPEDYLTIEDAIDAAEPGDAINVGPGTYPEELWIDKDIFLCGAGADKVTIKGNITVASGSPHIEGFRITGSSFNGITVNHYTKPTIRHNIIENNPGNGIDVWSKAKAEISYNIIRHNSYCGVKVDEGATVTGTDNEIYDNGQDLGPSEEDFPPGFKR